MSAFDQKVEMANQMVKKWMSDPINRQHLNDKKAQYIHDKGWSVGRTLKNELDIPSEAFCMLPAEIREDKKRLIKWVEDDHPYLMYKRIV